MKEQSENADNLKTALQNAIICLDAPELRTDEFVAFLVKVWQIKTFKELLNEVMKLSLIRSFSGNSINNKIYINYNGRYIHISYISLLNTYVNITIENTEENNESTK
jgi:hypothetical protein